MGRGLPQRLRQAPRRRVVVVAGLVLLLVVAAGLVLLRWPRGGPLDDAAAATPAEALRLSFTDWAAIRERLDPGPLRDQEAMAEFVSRGYDTDLTASSSIEGSAWALQDNFGFGPANLAWEALAQGRSGSSVALAMEEDVDFDELADRLRDLGFAEPEGERVVWDGGIDLVSGIDPTITPQFQYVALLPDQGLVVASDSRAYAATAARAAQGESSSLRDVDGVEDLLASAGEPASAGLWAGDFACEDLSMAAAGPEEQQQADRLVAEAGGVAPLSGLLVGMAADRRLEIVLGFESDEQARDDLEPRARLAVGEAVGRAGSYPELAELTRSRTEGATVVLDLRPIRDEGFVLSELNAAPVLLATC